MIDISTIKMSDYNYQLDDNRIAKFPLQERDQSKLLVYRQGTIHEDIFENIHTYLPQKSLMIFNNTKVIQARIYFRKETGSLIEVFLLEPAVPADYEQMFQTTGRCSWYCMVGNLKKWKGGSLHRTFDVNGKTITLSVTLAPETHKSLLVHFEWDDTTLPFSELIDTIGELPIPPYLNRETTESDKTTYQTVYSKIKGSVAAPTAGLHFTEKVLHNIQQAGIDTEEVTLHVGAGTFKPVKGNDIVHHDMHTEYIFVRKEIIQKLLAHQGKAIAVGTTSVRTLESLYYIGVKLEHNPQLEESNLHVEQWEPYQQEMKHIEVCKALENILNYMDAHQLNAIHANTQIMLIPGYEYKIVERLITNFHQPQSTLLLLVSAFVNGDWKNIYQYALDHEFRFLSYGDSSLLIP